MIRGSSPAAGGDLEPLPGRVVAQCLDDLLAGRPQARLRQVVSEQVDRRHQRLRLQRQQARRAGEVVAVGVGVHLDLVADDLGVEHVGAAAEVDDVQHIDVLAQLVHRDVQLLEHAVGGEARPLSCGGDQEPRQAHQPGEPLRADDGLGAPVGASAAVGVRGRASHDLGDAELAPVALAQQLEPGGRILRQLGRLQQLGMLAPAQHPRDELAPRRVLGLVDQPATGRAVGLRRLAHLAVLAGFALDQPPDPLAQEHLRRALDRPHLPVGARGVVAAVEVLGRGEVVLGLGRVGDLALDPREPEDPHLLALVGVTDQVELADAEDEVVGVDLAVGDLVALERVVGELDRLAPGDGRLDLRQALGDLAARGGVGHVDVDRRAVALCERARPPPGDLLQREAKRLGVGELAVEQPKRGPQRRQLAVGELDRRQVVVLGRQRVELSLEEPLRGLLDLERDAQALELRSVGVEPPRKRVLVHRAVALDLPLDLERRDRAAVGHEERDQRKLADQLLGVLRHCSMSLVARPQSPPH